MTDAERLAKLEQDVEKLTKLCRVQQSSLATLHERLEILRRPVESIAKIFLKMKAAQGQGPEGRN